MNEQPSWVTRCYLVCRTPEIGIVRDKFVGVERPVTGRFRGINLFRDLAPITEKRLDAGERFQVDTLFEYPDQILGKCPAGATGIVKGLFERGFVWQRSAHGLCDAR